MKIVLDANILLRAVWGSQVQDMLQTYDDRIDFYSVELCFEEAREHMPSIARQRRKDLAAGMASLNKLREMIDILDAGMYEECKEDAIFRTGSRDHDDWPLLAISLLLECPIWTEDQDFFGCGVATWSTRNVGIYLRGKPAS